MAEEARGLRERAAANVVDGVGRNAQLHELCADDATEIDVGARVVPPDDLLARYGGGDLSGDVFTHLERVEPDVGSDGREHRRRRDAALSEDCEGGRNDAADRAAPAGVNRGHGPRRSVGDEERDAVCGSYRDPTLARPDDQRVRFDASDDDHVFARLYLPDDPPVHLAHLVQNRNADCRGEATAVLGHRLRVVSDGPREIEAVERGQRHAARPEREAVRELVTGQERGGQDEIHAGMRITLSAFA